MNRCLIDVVVESLCQLQELLTYWCCSCVNVQSKSSSLSSHHYQRIQQQQHRYLSPMVVIAAAVMSRTTD